ncbi:MAG: esterase [Spirochaetes bacterium]|nr:esterase [Spirochaetota bacterium]
MGDLITTLGRIDASTAGIILPHEHVFVDLRTPNDPAHGCADAAAVVAVMSPGLRSAQGAGIGVIVEASCVGVGRRADILRAVSEATGFPLVVPTGVYREPWIPAWVHEASEDRLFEWMSGELAGEIGRSGVRAGWIKLSAGDDGLTECEAKVFRAAVRAAKETFAVIGSHTIRGRVVREQLRILESLGWDPGRFIWIHTQAEKDFSIHLEIARRGAWVEYDGIGSPGSDPAYVNDILKLLDAGFGQRILLSQDRGQYDPAKPRGGEQKSYTYLSDEFLPQLGLAGVREQTIRLLTRANPFSAFAR